MQVAGDIRSLFLMAIHSEDFQGKNVIGNQTDFLKTCLFTGLFFCYGSKIEVAVSMTTQPSPGIVQIVIGHQDFGPFRIDYPGGGGEMDHQVLPTGEIGILLEELQHQGFVGGFLLVAGLEIPDLLNQFLFHHPNLLA